MSLVFSALVGPAFATTAVVVVPTPTPIPIDLLCGHPPHPCIEIRDADGVDFPLERWKREQETILRDELDLVQIVYTRLAGEVALTVDGVLLEVEDAEIAGDRFTWLVPVPDGDWLRFQMENDGDVLAIYDLTIAGAAYR
jgi:hypothetical protein